MGYNKQFISSQALNADYTSKPQQIVDSSGYAIQLAFSGDTCNFGAKLEVSSDPYNNDPNFVPAHWDDLPDSPQTFTEEGTFSFNVNPAEYVWVRVVVTDNSSGANDGFLDAQINVKGPLN